MGLLATDMVYEYVSTAYQRLSTLDVGGPRAAVRGARGASPPAARRGRRPGRPRHRPANRRLPVPRAGLRAPRRRAGGRDRRRLGREGPLGLPRHPRARVLAPLRGVGHRAAERPRPRHRAHGASRRRRSRPAANPPKAALRHEGTAWFRVDGALREVATRYYDRDGLEAGNRIEGPAIVNQYDTTTVVPPGIAAHVDRFGNIVIEVGASAEARAIAEGMEVSA